MVDPILVTPDPGGVGRRPARRAPRVLRRDEIATQLEWIGADDGLFHRRDRHRHEVDLVVERNGGFVAIEVKRAREVPRGARSGIDAFRERYAARFRRGIVFYAGRNVLPLGDDSWAVPITSLWCT